MTIFLFTTYRKIFLSKFTENKKCMHVATGPTCGPLRILSHGVKLVIEPPGDDLEGVLELPCPPDPLPPNTQVEGALSGIKESVSATPTPLEGKYTTPLF